MTATQGMIASWPEGMAGTRLLDELWEIAEHGERLGSGSSATVFAHPDRDNLAIRACSAADGWLRLAFASLEKPLSDLRGILIPTVHDIVFTVEKTDGSLDGGYFALVERMEAGPEPASNDKFDRLVDAVRCVFCGRNASVAEIELINEMMPRLLVTLPHLRRALRRENFDARAENLLTIDGHIIVNDPCGIALTGPEIDELAARRFVAPPIPVREKGPLFDTLINQNALRERPLLRL